MWWQLFLVWGGLLAVLPWLISGRHIDMQMRISGSVAGLSSLTLALQNTKSTSGLWWVAVPIGVLAASAALLGRWRYRRLTGRGRRASAQGRKPGAVEDWAAEGRALLARFDDERDVRVLEAGISMLSRAATSSSPSDRRLEHTGNLVLALLGKYERLRRTEDLDRAIDTADHAVAVARLDAPRRDVVLALLSRALRVRYDHFGDAADLERAIETGRSAVQAAAENHTDPHPSREQLGSALHSLYRRSRDRRHIDEAIRLLEQSVAGVGRYHRLRVAALVTGCLWANERAQDSGRLSDLDEAVALGEQAVRRSLVGHLYRHLARMNLAAALHARYARRGDVADLDRAVRCAQRAAAAFAPGDPLRARAQCLLARTLRSRYERRHDPEDLTRALEMARTATRTETVEVELRIIAGLLWADTAARHGEYQEGVTAFGEAIELLPRMADPDLSWSDQEYRLGHWSGLAQSAAACAVTARQPEKALSLLEGGRGILLARAVAVPSHLAELRRQHPRLAAELELVSGRLAGSEGVPPPHSGPQAAHRAERRALRERENEVLRRVRRQPGFEDFGLIPSPTELMALASEGPIVCLNCSPERSDALLVTRSGVRTVPLPGASWDEVAVRAATFQEAVEPDGFRDLAAQQSAGDVLAWMWTEIAEPVLNALRLPEPPGRGVPGPRVWWVPTGLMSLLPIHAAGRHETLRDPHPATVLDRTTSSYTPTVRALAAARAANVSTGADPRPLVVALSETPGERPLAHATPEADLVRSLFPRTRTLSGSEAIRRRVITELSTSTWVHFACHGISDPQSPSRSRLLLHDHREHDFAVSDVRTLRLGGTPARPPTGPAPAGRVAGGPELAYLSACDSARPTTELVDEAINLASAFQLAGFPQVVATLWPLLDSAAQTFAEDFYRELRRTNRPRPRLNAAAAVHRATFAARERYPHFPSVWASHLHVGA